MARCSVLLVLLCACDDLGEFKTDPDEVFRGEVVGSDSGGSESSFIRQGFPSHTQLELTFDPQHASLLVPLDGGEAVPSNGPGTLSSYLCTGGKSSCPQAERTAGPIALTPLLPIESLAHDALSDYTFPGGRRVRNYIFGARFSNATNEGKQQRYAMVFISLMDNGQIEARVIAPSVLGKDLATELAPALFGVFVLGRHHT